MRLALDIENGRTIHKTIIASAVLHLLFIAIVAVPTRTKEREDKSYFVHLIAPDETEKIRYAALPDNSDIRQGKIVKAEPKKKEHIQETDIYKAMPEENKYIVKPLGNQISRAYRGTAFEEKEEVQKQQYIIARENRPVQTGPVRIDKGQREPIPAPYESFHQQQDVIARAGNAVRTVAEPLDKGNRGLGFKGKEDFQEQQVTIAGKDRQPQKETVPTFLKSGANGNSVFDTKRNLEIDAAEKMNGAGAIEKPGLPEKSGGGEITYKRRDEQASEDAGEKRETGEFASNKLSTSEFSIQGVPLHDLIACPNALDERALKKKILKIIGDNKKCNSPVHGKFLFLGTGRFTSFDMIIMPVSGRELSNRCEELENAYLCLNSIGE